MSMDSANLLTLLQISDSAFPTGGFAHSGGLESALKYNLVKTTADLEQFLICSLENAGSFSLPFVTEAYRSHINIDRICQLDGLLEACTSNHVAKRASIRQGKSLLEMCQKTFPEVDLVSLQDRLPWCHQAVVVGAVCGRLELGLDATQNVFMFGVLRTIMASAVRLDVIGPVQAQQNQHQLQKSIPSIIDRNKERQPEDATLRYPHIDIIQNCQDSLFSKLFYS